MRYKQRWKDLNEAEKKAVYQNADDADEDYDVNNIPKWFEADPDSFEFKKTNKEAKNGDELQL